MFGKVKKILASEFMYAKHIPEEEAMRYLDHILKEICSQTVCD